MIFDYSKLKGRIKEVCGTQESFAVETKMGRVSLSLSLNNKREFSQKEIMNACTVLKINPSEIPLYFFTTEV